jgi:hypothetical protein
LENEEHFQMDSAIAAVFAGAMRRGVYGTM